MRLARPVLLALSLSLLLLSAGCRGKAEENLKGRVVTIISGIKNGSLKDSLQYVSPKGRQAIEGSASKLGIPLEDLIGDLPNFPLWATQVVSVPEPDQVTIKITGRFARAETLGQTLKLVRDRKEWYLYLDTPIENESYGAFKG